MSFYLLNTHSLDITSYTARRLGSGGKYVDGDATVAPDIKGSLQPMREGDSQMKLPEGIASDDVRVFYTKTKIFATNSNTKIPSDTTVIDSQLFEAFRVFDWTGFGLPTDHYRAVFIRKENVG